MNVHVQWFIYYFECTLIYCRLIMIILSARINIKCFDFHAFSLFLPLSTAIINLSNRLSLRFLCTLCVYVYRIDSLKCSSHLFSASLLKAAKLLMFNKQIYDSLDCVATTKIKQCAVQQQQQRFQTFTLADIAKFQYDEKQKTVFMLY